MTLFLIALFFLVASVWVFSYKYMVYTKVPLNEANRMLRIGFGKHEGAWFFRIDMWFFGIRISEG